VAVGDSGGRTEREGPEGPEAPDVLAGLALARVGEMAKNVRPSVIVHRSVHYNTREDVTSIQLTAGWKEDA
jgi:hypothetical protein